jgi:hypothetical protein
MKESLIAGSMKDPAIAGALRVCKLNLFSKRKQICSMQDVFDEALERYLSKPIITHSAQSRRAYQKSISKSKNSGIRRRIFRH